MYFVKNMSFLKVSGQMVSIAVFSVFLLHRLACGKFMFWHFFRKSDFVRHYNCSKSCFWKVFWPPFVHLINSKCSINVWKLLNLSYLQKVAKTFFKNTIYFVQMIRKWCGLCTMYVLYVCITCMYYIYICIVCMYNMCYMYMLYVCKASWLSLPPGGKNP